MVCKCGHKFFNHEKWLDYKQRQQCMGTHETRKGVNYFIPCDCREFDIR